MPGQPKTSRSTWLKTHLFSSPLNSLLTIIGLYVLFVLISGVLDWAVFTASWSGTDRSACLKPEQGACWPFVAAKIKQFIYGNYPRQRAVATQSGFSDCFGGSCVVDASRNIWQKAGRCVHADRISVDDRYSAGRRFLWPDGSADQSLGRPASDAGDCLCRYRVVFAARHSARFGPAIRFADGARPECCLY